MKSSKPKGSAGVESVVVEPVVVEPVVVKSVVVESGCLLEVFRYSMDGLFGGFFCFFKRFFLKVENLQGGNPWFEVAITGDVFIARDGHSILWRNLSTVEQKNR